MNRKEAHGKPAVGFFFALVASAPARVRLEWLCRLLISADYSLPRKIGEGGPTLTRRVSEGQVDSLSSPSLTRRVSARP